MVQVSQRSLQPVAAKNAKVPDWGYLVWILWVAANVATYFLTREKWEIVWDEKRSLFGIGTVNKICFVTHNILIAYLWTRWKER